MSAGWTVKRFWEGHRVFVLAGGQSLMDAPVDAIPAPCIAVKHAALLKPYAQVLFWAGRTFHIDFANVIDAHRGAWKIKRTVDPGVPDWIHQIDRLEPGPDGIPGLSRDPAKLGGFCSGASALNLAYLLGAAEIVLVGFDMHGRHWMEGHPDPEPREETFARHVSAFEAMAPELARDGVRVLNASPTSRITCFPKVSIHEVL